MTVPGVPGTWDRLRTLQHIRLALPRFVKLSNWTAGEFDVSLAPYRKIRKRNTTDRPLVAVEGEQCRAPTSARAVDERLATRTNSPIQSLSHKCPRGPRVWVVRNPARVEGSVTRLTCHRTSPGQSDGAWALYPSGIEPSQRGAGCWHNT